jgi:hypothetical protein
MPATSRIASSGLSDPRDERRRKFLWSGVLQTARGPMPCLVAELSRGGARLSLATELAIGQAVTLVVAGSGSFRGSVAWTEAGSVGLEFGAAQSASAA